MISWKRGRMKRVKITADGGLGVGEPANRKRCHNPAMTQSEEGNSFLVVNGSGSATSPPRTRTFAAALIGWCQAFMHQPSCPTNSHEFLRAILITLPVGNVVKRRSRVYAPALDLFGLRMHACFPAPVAQYRDHSWRTLSRLLLGRLD